MNVLVALSTGMAYIASVVMMVIDIHTSPEEAAKSTQMRSYFDSCVFLTFFILAGKALEARAKFKVRTTLSRHLLKTYITKSRTFILLLSYFCFLDR